MKTAVLILSLFLCVLLSACDPAPVPVTTSPTTTTPTTTAAPTTTAEPTTTVPETTAPRYTGWTVLDGKTYYFDGNHVMLTGWQEIDGQKYYFTPEGPMAVGRQEVDGEVMHFGSDGIRLLLVNPWNFAPEGYSPEVVDINGWQYSAAECYQPLMDMLQACRDAGLVPYIASAYRTHADQVYLHNNKINRLMAEGYSEEEARRLAGTVVAVPGTSEHELGLAFDLVDNSYRDLDEAQENTAVQKWLMENSWRFGFILRYPSSKSEITGIIYEPWHYRYVGKTVAKEIYESGLCLEEYLESLS